MRQEDWNRLEESLTRLGVEQLEQRLEISPLLFAGETETAEEAISLDCSLPREPLPGKTPDPTWPVPWPTPTGPTLPDPPEL